MTTVLRRGFLLGSMVLGMAAGAWGQSSVALSEPSAPLLPASFGEWKTASAGAASAGYSLSNVSKDALEECGPQRSQVVDYTRDGHGLHVEAIQFGDRTGAFSAFTLATRPDMSWRKDLGSTAAVGDGAVLFTVGTSIVLAQPATAADIAMLKPLAESMPKIVGNKGVAALLPTLLPEKGLVDGSVRYALGAASYQAEGGILPANSLGWEKSAEAVTAKYSDKRGAETLTMLLYPTPTIAGSYTRVVQGLIGSAGAEFAKVRREGELVLLASGSFSGDEAEHMIENIHLKQQVSIDNDIEPSEHTKIVQTYSLLTNIAILTGVLMLAAILLGLFLGGGRAAYRVMRGKPAASEPEFLSLHLNPQSKPVRFGEVGNRE
jgi:hypothetical protein